MIKYLVILLLMLVTGAGCAYTPPALSISWFPDPGMTKQQIDFLYRSKANPGDNLSICNPGSSNSYHSYNRAVGTELIRPPVGRAVFLFKEVTQPLSNLCYLDSGLNRHTDLGNGKLVGHYFNLQDAISVQTEIAVQQKIARQENQTQPPSKTPRNPSSRAEVENSTPRPSPVGTGFFISSEGHLLTNDHVIRDCGAVNFVQQNRRKPATVLASDSVNDLAILETNVAPDRALHIGKVRPELAEEIFVAGFPFSSTASISKTIKVTKGIVSSVSGLNNNFSNIQIDAALQPGNSGGPIVNEEGNAVAVAVAGLNVKFFLERYGAVPEGTNFGVKAAVAESLMQSLDIEAVEPNAITMSTTELARALNKATVLIECELESAGDLDVVGVARADKSVSADGVLSVLGMKLTETDAARISGGVLVSLVKPNSPADDAGVRAGDVLTRLGRRAIGSIEDLTNIKDGLSPGSQIPVRIIRGNRPLFIGIRIP